jgi:rhodanese-related sulfurtransferase
VLDHGAQRRFGGVSPAHLAAAQASAQVLADRAGAVRLTAATLAVWEADTSRTLYRWDVRTPEEYAAGHLPGFGSAPGGQLVQETDVCAAVRGARIALADGGPASDGVRAAMTAHWLAQMGWEVGWLTDNTPDQHTAQGPWQPAFATLPAVAQVDVPTLAAWRDAGRTLVLDVGTSAAHVKGHVPGAHWLLRTDLRTIAPELPAVDQVVFTCGDGRLAQLAAADFQRLTGRTAHALAGGTAAWLAAGAPLEPGEANLLSLRIDRYRRPYEGTDAPREAMQGYLDWEFGLVAQLGRDGTHHFRVLPAA